MQKRNIGKTQTYIEFFKILEGIQKRIENEGKKRNKSPPSKE